ncbi:MAG: ribonuclease Z [Chloroflexota bacterium]
MKPTFHASPVNMPFEDPCLYVRILREKRALLFDLGDISPLHPGHLLKTSDVFVTHMHIDHFIGFDTLLRAALRKEAPLVIHGPSHITNCIEGKLKGYTWNLIESYPLRIEVKEITGHTIICSSFHAEHSFKKIEGPEIPFTDIAMSDTGFSVKGLVLSHPIPVMAYSLEEDYHINVNKEALEKMGLPVGPWLSELKRAIRAGLPEEACLPVAGRSYALRELVNVVTITRGQKISYVMDVSPTEENIEKIIPFVRGSDVLFCEAYFLEKDRDRAVERNHLTAAMVGRVSREAAVGNLELMHVSPKYRGCADEVYREAMREFRGGAEPESSIRAALRADLRAHT